MGTSHREEQLRCLRAVDVAAASQLSTAAGWNQTPDDWRMLLAVSPQGCVAIEIGGEIVATATLMCYGRRLGWIGMVLTKTEYRGRGFARRLLHHLIAQADDRGVETLKLDATDQGQPLYEKLGFRPEQHVERWIKGSSAPASNESLTTASALDVNLCRDRAAFGADRSKLLRDLAERRQPLRSDAGFLFSRSGRTHSYMGPCVAVDMQGAQELLERCFRGPGDGWYWDLLPALQDAVALAKSFGFTPERRLLRMARGNDCRGREELIYAIAGFELG